MRFRGTGTTGTATRRRGGVVTLALVTMALSACTGGDGDSKVTTPAAAVVTPIPDTTIEPPPPEMPAAARERTLPGAEAMMRHVLALYDRAFATGDGAPFGALADKDCADCKSIVDMARENKEQGYIIEGGRLTIRGQVSTWSMGKQESVVTTDVTQADSSARKGSGPVITRSKGGKGQITAVLRWTPAGWRVASLEAEMNQ